jgi:hypothetical protein
MKGGTLDLCLAPGGCDQERCTYVEPGQGRGTSALCADHLIEAIHRIKREGKRLRQQNPKVHLPQLPDISTIR